MHLKSLALAAVIGCLGMSAAVAQEPQVVRQELMKEIGRLVGAMGAIAKGEKPYDAAVVEQSLTVIGTNIQAFPNHFPAGTESGHETEALPAIDRLTDEHVLRADLEDAVRLVWDHLHVVPIDQRCLDRAAGLSRQQPVRLTDAIHLAAAERLELFERRRTELLDRRDDLRRRRDAKSDTYLGALRERDADHLVHDLAWLDRLIESERTQIQSQEEATQ